MPPSPASHVPDIPSPLYPDRPIRPLPKQRIRSRLSSEVAESILYASAPSEPAPLFSYFPYRYSEAERVNGVRKSPNAFERNGDYGRTEHDGGPASEGELDSDEEDIGTRARRLHHGQSHYSEPNGLQNAAGGGPFLPHSPRFDHSSLPPKPPNSNSSSVDGYDSFENTKNKKKRKIPTPGNTSSHHSHLSADLANLGISSGHPADRSSPDELTGGTGQYYGSGYSASSVSGTTGGSVSMGKGRVGRVQWRTSVARSPLGVSTDGLNAWSTGRTPGRGRIREWAVGGVSFMGRGASLERDAEAIHRELLSEGSYKGDQSMFSAATATAHAHAAGAGGDAKPAAQALPNGSLLHQQASRKPTPAKTQFTFTASSDVAWPGGISMGSSGHFLGSAPTSASLNSRAAPFQVHMNRGDMATQGTQTSPNIPANRRVAQPVAPSQLAPGNTRLNAQPAPAATGNQQAPPPQAKKTRPRRSGKEYAMAARQRRLQQEYNNYHHPPSSDEIWICEFCEYESIFGTPPEALVRQYEIKDRQEQRRLEEKRRLLEKAKMKGRKGKKGGKPGAKGSAASTPNPQQQPHQHHHMGDPSQMQSQGTQSEEYLPDEFFDDEDVTIPVPEAPATTGHVHMSQGKVTPGKAMLGPNGSKAMPGGDVIKAK